MMDPCEFDQFAEEYHRLHLQNIRASGESPEFFAAYKVRDVARHVAGLGIPVKAILDFGGGVGNSIPYFRQFMPWARLVCADVSQKSLDIAGQRFPRQAELHHIQGESFATLADRFDVIFSACVFHHIPHAEHLDWLTRLREIARPGALLALFEHNPWNPLTVQAVNTCPFDINARLISAPALRAAVRAAGWRAVKTEFRVFFPASLSRLRPLERWLTRLPLGAQHAVYARA